MKTAIYVLMSIGAALIFTTMKLMSAPSGDNFEFAHRAIISGLGLFGIGLIMTGLIGITYILFFEEKENKS